MATQRLKLAGGAALLLLAGVAVGVLSRPGQSGGAMEANTGAGRGGQMRGAMLPAITSAPIISSSVEKRIDAIGSSRAARSVTLVAEATGLVKAVNFKSGERVSAGDILLNVDDSEPMIALARIRAQYPIAKANADRYADLLENDAASRLESETAFNAFKAMQAELAAAEYAVSQRTIRAPFAGVVGLTSIEAGDYIRAGDIATTIDDLSTLIIEFTVPQESASDVELGQAVFAALASGQREQVKGAVSAIDSRVDAASRTLKIEATFENAEGALLPGATYEVTTTNEGAKALAMPGLAAQWDRTGAYVWKLGPEGEVARVAVRILQRRGETVIAEGVLKPGDLVIVEGADRVRPGMSFPSSVKGAVGQAASG